MWRGINGKLGQFRSMLECTQIHSATNTTLGDCLSGKKKAPKRQIFLLASVLTATSSNTSTTSKSLILAFLAVPVLALLPHLQNYVL